ncbi:MAG: glutamine-hydrolyzing carbamoyl-phosphate synthase small subunit [Myxococcales bacterium]|nr:glutamine-hydrolyzing carbamoyl-phosphate synthase small subunit [Myxococcales bacterium]
MTTALLALADGRVFRGRAFGHAGRAVGEVVFNTSMTGYQEILTDPSYHGQLVAMTASQIGNTGVNEEDPESARPHVGGFIAREFSRRPSNWRATRALDDWMREWGVVGIHGIDTRRLTRLLREKGVQRGIIASGDALEGRDDAALVADARALPDISTIDTVRHVTASRRYEYRGDRRPGFAAPEPSLRVGPLVAVLDCGIKSNILRRFREHGVRTLVFPATATADEILESGADGLFLSNGPGDPETTSYVVETVKALMGRLPMLGICLGHQILALASGARTYKLKFGHHGANHPVVCHETGRIEITSQNHNYAVDADSAAEQGFEVTHRSLFDGTVQGMWHPELGLYSVQYHPEAAPGPHDAAYLWERFLDHLHGRAA